VYQPPPGPEPRPSSFTICRAGTCAVVAPVSVTPTQWRQVTAALAAPAPDAGTERAQIAAAVAGAERLVGPLTGTEGDVGGTFQGFGLSGQMDCIDEATNTSTYLRMLAAEGLLRHHRFLGTTTRGYFLLGWPHTTAVIEETATGARYVVDSWFHANGRPPEVLPLDQWRSGWSPGEW
jgi:hypothetical protein